MWLAWLCCALRVPVTAYGVYGGMGAHACLHCKSAANGTAVRKMRMCATCLSSGQWEWSPAQFRIQGSCRPLGSDSIAAADICDAVRQGSGGGRGPAACAGCELGRRIANIWVACVPSLTGRSSHCASRCEGPARHCRRAQPHARTGPLATNPCATRMKASSMKAHEVDLVARIAHHHCR